MGKSSPSAPPPPDPTATAAAQTQSNIATANANANLNRTNQVTPYGNLTYSRGETANPDGTYNWTATTSLSPEQQKLLESSNGISQSMANLGQQQINNVAATATRPLDFSSLPQVRQGQLQSSVAAPTLQNSISGVPAVQNQVAGAGDIQKGVASAGDIQKGVASAGDIQRQIDTSKVGDFTNNVKYGQIQNSLDTSGVPSLVGGDALAQTMREQQQAAFNQQKGYLDPQFEQQQHDLENKLVQQGVMQNSDAWNRAMGDFNRQRTFAYQNANDNSVGLGNAAQAQLYGQGLSSNQNAFGQALTSGNFTNSAQAQGFGQGMQNAGLNNDVVNSQFAQEQAKMQAALQAQQQQYMQNANNMTQANAAQQQQYGQNSNNMTQGNNAQQQQFGQNAASMTLGNAAQQQQFGQALDRSTLNNSAAQSTFNNGLMNAQLNNQTAGQDYAQSTGARNQALNELLTQQQNPLNVLNALRTGSQVTNPTFGSTPQSNVAGTDIAGITQNGYQNQLGAYNAQQAQNNGITSGLFGLGSAGLGGFAGSQAGGAALAAMF